MSSLCTVLIAAQAALPGLTDRAAADGGDVLAFSDVEALRALEAIINRRPDFVALEQVFAASPRGAALINRVRADPALSRCEVRVVAWEIDASPTPPPPALWAASPPMPPEMPPFDDTPQIEESPAAPEEGLDELGTRRAQRLWVADVDVTLDGNAATLVDLSTLGAQVLSPLALRPNQRIRIVIADAQMNIRLAGTIAWAEFEIPPESGPRYRAGIEFVGPDTTALDRLCRAHQA